MEPRSNEFNQFINDDLNWWRSQPLKVRLDVMQSHLSICQIMANQLMEEEVVSLAGERYSREKPHGGRYSRWSSNPGSIRVGDQRVKLSVPRVRDMQEGECVSLESYGEMRNLDELGEQIVRGVLKGLSTRDYESVIDHMGEGFGLSKSQVSRRFIEKTSEELERFMNRDLSGFTFVAIFIDGKSLGEDQIIIAMGITDGGKKIPIDFIQAHSEKSEPVEGMLRRMKSRGINVEEVLFIVDGSKGFRKAIKRVCGEHAPVQRCTWHKVENIKSYLAEEEHHGVKTDFYSALGKESYEDAKIELLALEERLRLINISAANSLLEGMDEILTLHRMGIDQKLWGSFRTTNCIENLNSQLGKYLRKVKRWQNSDQKHRWMATALLETENKMHRIKNYRLIPLMRKAILLYIAKGTSF